ncbi:3-hydroxyisobutyrate dehydrogenase [Vibrio parahaemolyticus]|uniref:3-hydroxyisobutyrate dehydrogenase n=1 Tax=Vibrio parahaemolyticus TaxID=670 RepID=UPI0003591B4C|nr:3-hydroxyisobutyrate dehydrogenase [Vibrio parahaemolyticus]AGQ96647.1 3-hydroxyisobutyrate dehydrogenase [Vibrio parahaemolyticus O1:K33 str. CDC_K4557]EHH1100168.1 3-hydroxyisobutyrate dehydrogenase [Vibrio parahaemolyticus]EIN4361529.1 3-hydroxyisobutyrate dehydrogenase [Vibrio parahaemolyticus]MBD6947553.1 3-hydroxyisobutyrate dehydrogenase [Vibrio parahaemolyticus]MBD6977491.1 3-hydroxyisobutyrate dehydrogenase [Vibrio parahaemolyticus]
MDKIAFIGLGNMGAPMAKNLLKAGLNVEVFDLNPNAVEELTALGASSADSVKQAVQGADVVVTMLPASQHVQSVYLGQDGILDSVESGTLLIDSSTIDPATALSVGEQAELRGISFVDAPVSGGVAGAAAGTLTFIVGGSQENFIQAKAVLSNMGKNIFHAGDAGAGQVAKICNNMMLGILMSGTCEALNLGMENGLDPKVLSDIMLQSSGRNWALELYNPCPGVMENTPASNGYQGGFMSQLMAKDLGLAMEAAVASQTSTPMGSLARNLFNFHNGLGNGQKDFSSLFEFYQKQNQA